MTDPAVTIRGYRKQYGAVTALDGVDLDVPAGSVFGLLGPNGAGKTTLIRLLLGLARPDAGTATVFGGPPASTHIGHLPDVPTLYPWMTGREWLDFAHALVVGKGTPHSAELLDLAGLPDSAQRIGGYSRGMRQRLGVVSTLIGAPRLLVLDEPTSALDPIGRRDVLDLVAKLRGRATVLLSTHALADVELVCDHAAVLASGRLLASGSIADLRARKSHASLLTLRLDGEDAPLLRALRAAAWVESVERTDTALLVRVTDPAAAAREIPRLVTENGLGLRELTQRQATLEDVFLDLVGGAA